MVGLFDDISISRFGSILKDKKLAAKISYGSGGFCVIFTDRFNERGSGYSWDLETAAARAFENLSSTKKTLDEEKTSPQGNLSGPYRFKLASILPPKKK
jgi:hypothetical protein